MIRRVVVWYGAAVALGVVVFLTFAWPYRGLVPLLSKPPIIPSTTTPVEGKNTTGLPLTLPEGFSINIFAKDLGAPRVLEFAPGEVLLASIPNQGKVVALPDLDRDGKADERKDIATGLNKPHGLAFGWKGSIPILYVAETDKITTFEYDAETSRVDHKFRIAGLPSGGGHSTRTLLPLPDGRLLISIGSTCNVCHEADARRGSIQIIDRSGANMKPFAVGLRNSVFMTRGPDGKVWATEMGRDLLGDDIPPDEINIVEEGKNYGWPNCYGKNIHDTAFDKNTYIRNPCMEPLETQSLIDLQAHSAPLGLAFVPSNSSWPKEYWGNLLVAYHGSWNRTVPTGYKIRRFVLDGTKVTHEEDFITGWHGTNKDEVLGRPVGLAFDADANLYISDDRAGVVYRVTPPK